MTHLLKIGLVLLLATLGACRADVGICDEDDEQSFCCWTDDDGGARCAVTSWCVSEPPVCDYSQRTTQTWVMDSGLDAASAHWEAQPCHSEDVGLRDTCE